MGFESDHLERRNVIVLGAGGSADFGLPLGAEMIDEAIGITNKVADSFRNTDSSWAIEDLRSVKRGLLLPFIKSFDAELNAYAEIPKFRETLVDTDAETLDSFALKHPAYSVHCRHLTSMILFERLYEKGTNVFRRRRFGRKVGGGRNWIDVCTQAITNHVRIGTNTKWSIINFNYDMILEPRMRKNWSSIEGKFPDIDSVVEFIYPHGCFGIDDTVGHPPKTLEAWASSIKYAHETDEQSDSCCLAFSRVSHAHNIYTFGFAFAETNCKLIGLIDNNRTSDDTNLYTQNFGNNLGVKQRIENLSVNSTTSFSGKCYDIILNGMLGELPA